MLHFSLIFFSVYPGEEAVREGIPFVFEERSALIKGRAD
jgi:hypothetical protein